MAYATFAFAGGKIIA